MAQIPVWRAMDTKKPAAMAALPADGVEAIKALGERM